MLIDNEMFLSLHIVYAIRGIIKLLTPTRFPGVKRSFASLCLFVCSMHNSKTNDPKVFKLGVGNELRMSCK